MQEHFLALFTWSIQVPQVLCIEVDAELRGVSTRCPFLSSIDDRGSSCSLSLHRNLGLDIDAIECALGIEYDEINGNLQRS
jgi:hypothetical protein